MTGRLLVGPWPFHGLAVWSLLTIVVVGVLYRLSGPNPLVPQSAPLSTRLIMMFIYGVGGPGLVVLPLVAYQRLRRRITKPVTAVEYMLSLFIASALAAALLSPVLSLFPTLEVDYSAGSIPVAISRFFIPTWFINALLGAFLERLQTASQLAQESLKVVKRQRRFLLESEERVRSQVAIYLHDRVQTDLVSIGLRLRGVIEMSPEHLRGELVDSLAEIERVRSQEVRRASRRLSPDIGRIGLETALFELASAYRPGMTVTISLAESLLTQRAEAAETTKRTAVYRICEQGLLNAAVHGHASECWISVTETPGHSLHLELRDNGVGFGGSNPPPGTGLTLISAWVESLNGDWTLTDTGAGAVLTATLPGSQSPEAR